MKERGQSTIEVVVLFVIIAAAVFLMRAYIQRGLQGKIKEDADKIGTGWSYQADDPNINTYYEYTHTERSTVEDTYSTGVTSTVYQRYVSRQNTSTNVAAIDSANRPVLFQNDL